MWHLPGSPGTVLGVNGFGDLQWGTPSTIAWMLNGNTIGSTEFIGTLNAEHFRVRTNNNEHFHVRGNPFVTPFRTFPEGSFVFNENPADNSVRITYGQVVINKPASFISDPNAVDGVDEGLTIFNNNGVPGIPNRSASLCLGSRDEGNDGFWSFSSISSVSIGVNQADLIFKNEYTTPQRLRMTMRIAHTGNVGIGPNAVDLSSSPTARLHVDGNVRFENLPTGSGNVLVIDANGYVYRSTCPCREQPIAEMEDMQAEIDQLKKELSAIKSMLANMPGQSAGYSGGSYHVTVFPNPNDGTFQVKFINNDPTLQNAPVQIIMMDAGGKFVYQTDMRIPDTENYKSISDLHVAAGLYTVLFQSQGKILATENIIIK